MSMKPTLLPGLLLTLALASACGKDDGSNASSVTNVDALQGGWTGACKVVGDAYGQTKMSFSGLTYTYKSTQYADAGCTQLDNFVFTRGTYSLPGDILSEDGTTWLAMIDYVTVDATWTFVARPSLAVDWSPLCGNAAVVNNTIDVLGKTCSTGTYTLTFAEKTYGSMYVTTDIHPTDMNSNGGTPETRSKKYDKTYGALVRDVVEPDK